LSLTKKRQLGGRAVPRPKSLKPKHCHHTASGRGFVVLNGRFKYTGPWGSQQAQDAYDRLIGEWIAAGRPATPPPAAAPGDAGGVYTVNQLLAGFLQHAKDYYRRADGSTATTSCSTPRPRTTRPRPWPGPTATGWSSRPGRSASGWTRRA
jgi:hypothetical protein